MSVRKGIRYLFQVLVCLLVVSGGEVTVAGEGLSAPHMDLSTQENRLSVSWSSAENADGYTLLYAPYPTVDYIGQIDMGPERSVSFDLWPGAAFYLAVQSYNSSASSDISNVDYFVMPSMKVAAFYYPWYANPAVDGKWVGWDGEQLHPPLDISSDYYPVLGAYSSMDPLVLAEHFKWLRDAKVGLIITSWWGRNSAEDQAVPMLLQAAEPWGIKVAFHIEPYEGRSADQLVEDVKYLYSSYGSHPAFFRTTADSRWSPDNRSKGLFFVWAIVIREMDDLGSYQVDADYWQAAVDAVHALPDGGIVIANTTSPDWIDGGHFDGLYNYVTLGSEEPLDFDWSKGLPRDAWYVPSVIPGNSAQRIGYPPSTYVPRSGGATYDIQWETALGTYVEPAMVTITSFNEWNEGTQIEPAAAGMESGYGYTYQDYLPLEPTGYLDKTRRWVDRFLVWSWPVTCPLRVRISTTSDWTNFRIVSGGGWLRPELISASTGAAKATMEGDKLVLEQPIAQAENGNRAEMTLDLSLAFEDPEGVVWFEFERGHLGRTEVVFLDHLGGEIRTLDWEGINLDDPGNSHKVYVFASAFQCGVSSESASRPFDRGKPSGKD